MKDLDWRLEILKVIEDTQRNTSNKGTFFNRIIKAQERKAKMENMILLN